MSRLARLVRGAVSRLDLDLSGAVVLTEAATGPYVVTPVIAALAGAEVRALTQASRYGSIADVTAQTQALAEELGVADRITIATTRSLDLFADADVITNSSHLRPIDAEAAAVIRPGAVLPLMFEAWEIQAGRIDLDLDALRDRGVLMAGTNERHPAVDVFGHLGLMAVVQLADAGVSAYRNRIAVLCDNAFVDSLTLGLEAAGAHLTVATSLDDILDGPAPDALVVALTPTGRPVLTADDISRLASRRPDIVVTQFWGDLDREALHRFEVAHWPLLDPGAGHMGVLPSRLGPEPIVSLQAGGLKVAEVLRIPAADRSPLDREFLDEL